MRLFVAFDIPADVKQAVQRASADLRRAVSGTWLRSDSLHLTLAFIGEQVEETVEPLTSALHAAVTSHTPLWCHLNLPGFYPSAHRARVGWIGISPDDPLQSIAESVRAALRSAHVAHDDKPFRAHLTLVRFRQTPPADDLSRFMSTLQEFDSEPFLVDHVTLYSSVLSPHGAVHTALARVPLRGGG